MRQLKFKLILLCAFAASAVVLSTNDAHARLGEHWSKTRHQPFIYFFKFDSTTTFVNGQITLHPWAKRYAKTVGLQVTLGADSVVTGMVLTLDRAVLESDWMGLRDISKNFLREEIDVRDSLSIDTLANEIEFLLDKGVYYAGGVPAMPVEPTQDYQAFLGNKPEATDDLSHTKLTIRNVDLPDKKQLAIIMNAEALAGPR